MNVWILLASYAVVSVDAVSEVCLEIIYASFIVNLYTLLLNKIRQYTKIYQKCLFLTVNKVRTFSGCEDCLDREDVL